MYASATRAVAAIRTTGKPFFLETYTYRMRGHFEPDDQAYVDPQELAAWREKDPINCLRERLFARRAIDAAALVRMERRVAEAIEQGLSFAKASPFPELAELATNVYA